MSGPSRKRKPLAHPRERFAEDVQILQGPGRRRIDAQLALALPASIRGRREEEADRYYEQVADLNCALARSGIPFEIGVLGKVRAPYPEAIPILIEHVQRAYPPRTLMEIVSAMGRDYAGPEAHRVLKETLERRLAEFPDWVLFQLGIAIAKTARRADRDDLVRIAADARYGQARLVPLERLARWKDPAVESIVHDLLAKDLYAGIVMDIARLARVASVAPLIEPYLLNVDLRSNARLYFRTMNPAEISFRTSARVPRSPG